LNTSVGAFYAYLVGDKADKDALAGIGSYVDVRDVAQLHIDALVNPEAANKRFIVSRGEFSVIISSIVFSAKSVFFKDSLYYQPLLDVIHSPAHADLLAAFPKTIKGLPGSAAPIQNKLDTTRAKTTFNWAPIAFEKTVYVFVR
jgi:nucleoside-diphosphate-sugar epimerase